MAAQRGRVAGKEVVAVGGGAGGGDGAAAATAKTAAVGESRANLAAAVRRHFNSMPAEENAVAGELIYKVHSQGESSLLLFAAAKGNELGLC